MAQDGGQALAGFNGVVPDRYDYVDGGMRDILFFLIGEMAAQIDRLKAEG